MKLNIKINFLFFLLVFGNSDMVLLLTSIYKEIYIKKKLSRSVDFHEFRTSNIKSLY